MRAAGAAQHQSPADHSTKEAPDQRQRYCSHCRGIGKIDTQPRRVARHERGKIAPRHHETRRIDEARQSGKADGQSLAGRVITMHPPIHAPQGGKLNP